MLFSKNYNKNSQIKAKYNKIIIEAVLNTISK